MSNLDHRCDELSYSDSDEDVFAFENRIETEARVSSPSSINGGQAPSNMKRITLRRHRSTGFGFRPAGGVTVQPIVASVIKVSSAL